MVAKQINQANRIQLDKVSIYPTQNINVPNYYSNQLIILFLRS